MRGAFERRIGDGGQDSPVVRGLLPVAQCAPESRVGGGDKQQNGDDGAHRDQTIRGEQERYGPNPEARPIQRQFNIALLRDLTTHMTPWPFQGGEFPNDTRLRSFRRGGAFLGGGEGGAPAA